MNQEQTPLTERVLTPEQVKNGFSLEEDNHCIYLLLDGQWVAVFNTLGVTAATIREIADAIYTDRIKGERR
jgi:hypothetical protein